MESIKELLKRAIACALDYVEDKNYLPTTKQVAEALGESEDKATQIMQDSEYIKLKKLRDGYTSFEKECKDGFGGFRGVLSFVFGAKRDKGAINFCRKILRIR